MDRKEPKKIEYIDPSYLQELMFFIKPEVAINGLNKDDLEKRRFREDFATVYSRNPQLFNVRVAARKYVQNNGDDEEILNTETPEITQSVAAARPAAQANVQELPALNRLPV